MLEQALSELAAAIREHAAAQRGIGVAASTNGSAEPKRSPGRPRKDATPAVIEPQAEEGLVVSEQVPAHEKAPEATPLPPIELPLSNEAQAAPSVVLSYEKDVAPRILSFAERKGRAETVALLSQFGVQPGKRAGEQLKPEQYADVIAALEKALG